MAGDITTAIAAHTLTSSDSGTIDVVNTAFGGGTPAGAILVAAVDDAGVGGRSQNFNISIGATDGTSEWVFNCNSEHGQGTSDAHRAFFSVRCVDLPVEGGTGVDARYDENSMITNGVRLNVNNAADNNYSLLALLFGGTDLQLGIGTGNFNASDAGTVVVSTGFTGSNLDNQLIFIASHHESSAAASGGRLAFGVAYRDGAAGAPDGQGAISWGERNQRSTSEIGGALWNNRVAAQHNTNNPDVISASYEMTNISDSSFTITTRGASGEAGTFGWVALELDTVKGWVGASNPPTTATTQKTTTTIQPQIAGQLMGLIQTANTGSNGADASAFLISAFDEDTEASVCVLAEDGADTTDTHSVVASAAVNLDGFTGTTPSDEFDAVLNGGVFDSDGYTLSYSAADTTQRLGIGWAIGSEAAAGGRVMSSLVGPGGLAGGGGLAGAGGGLAG